MICCLQGQLHEDFNIDYAMGLSPPPNLLVVEQSLLTQSIYREALLHEDSEETKEISMAKQIFEKLDAHEAQLFSEPYGIWGQDPTKPKTTLGTGSRVRLSKNRL